jgi:hypothetical protein
MLANLTLVTRGKAYGQPRWGQGMNGASVMVVIFFCAWALKSRYGPDCVVEFGVWLQCV